MLGWTIRTSGARALSFPFPLATGMAYAYGLSGSLLASTGLVNGDDRGVGRDGQASRGEVMVGAVDPFVGEVTAMSVLFREKGGP